MFMSLALLEPAWCLTHYWTLPRPNAETFMNTALAYGIVPRGYRLPEALTLGPVRLQVSDLSRSLAFYTEVLGLRILSKQSDEALLGAADGTPLVELHFVPGTRPVPPRGRLGLFHFAILLPNRESLGRFIAHLSAIGARAGASDHLVSEALYLSDPDGLGIEVYSDRPRSAWRHEERQLVMATEPLDLRALVQAAGTEPWSGMPAGTTMGHLHLHVGDLARASAFYHDALGLDQMVWSYPGALFLAAGGYHHHLGLNTWAADASPAGEHDARLLSWEMTLPSADDLSAALASVERAGFAVVRESDGGIVQDPWGTALRLRR
jgi:catechol 2,3-dioxygenase